jgi:Rrf2 family cysteine metabolism transcriptional repressor
MKISTRARYGTRAMMDLALHRDQGAVMVKDISKRQQISARYLEQLLFSLKLAGMVTSSRGMGGGFTLAKPASEIRLLDIVQALDGPIAPVRCVDEPGMFSRSDYCAVRDVWVQVKEAANKVLESVTLEDLVKRQKSKETGTAGKDRSAVSSMKSRRGDEHDA